MKSLNFLLFILGKIFKIIFAKSWALVGDYLIRNHFDFVFSQSKHSFYKVFPYFEYNHEVQIIIELAGLISLIANSPESLVCPYTV